MAMEVTDTGGWGGVMKPIFSAHCCESICESIIPPGAKALLKREWLTEIKVAAFTGHVLSGDFATSNRTFAFRTGTKFPRCVTSRRALESRSCWLGLDTLDLSSHRRSMHSKKLGSGGIREAIRKLLAHLVTYSDPQVTTIERR